MSIPIDLDKIEDMDIKVYKVCLKHFYYQRLINAYYFLSDDETLNNTVDTINKWYRKELYNVKAYETK